MLSACRRRLAFLLLPLLTVLHLPPAACVVLQRYRFLEQVYKYHSSVEDEVRGNCSCWRARS